MLGKSAADVNAKNLSDISNDNAKPKATKATTRQTETRESSSGVEDNSDVVLATVNEVIDDLEIFNFEIWKKIKQ